MPASARDPSGLRNVSGELNNLIEGQTSWGSTGEIFLRLVNPDYAHYLQGDMTSNADASSSSTTTLASAIACRVLITENFSTVSNTLPRRRNPPRNLIPKPLKKPNCSVSRR